MTYWLTGVTGNTYNLPTPPTAWVKRLFHKHNSTKTKIKNNWLHTLFNVNHFWSLGRISKGCNKTLLRWSCPVWRNVWTGTAASKRLFPPRSTRGSPAAACSRTARRSTSTWLSLTIPVHSSDHGGASHRCSVSADSSIHSGSDSRAAGKHERILKKPQKDSRH